MKYIYILSIVLASLIGVSSCSDDFLDAESSNVITPDQTEDMGLELAKSYMSGVYVQLHDTEFRTGYDNFGIRALMFAADLMTDDIAYSPNPPYVFIFDYQNDNRMAGYRRTRTGWQQLYAYINATNAALRYLEPADESVELTSEEENYLGQAYALRGYCYFMLINLWQQPYSVNKDAPGVPVYTPQEEKPGRNTVKEVYDLILSDLKRSYDLLKGKGFTTAAILNEFAVAGLYARALCFVNDFPSQWEEVAKYADIAANGRSLMTGTQLLYGFNSLDNNEILWGSAIDTETTTYWASFFPNIDPFSGGYTEGYEPQISTELQSKIDQANDIRAKWFAEKADTINEIPMPKGTAMKFIDRGEFTSDYIYMRTAEMHFLKAEALYLNNDEPGAKSALETIMKTRLPGYTTSKTGAELLEEIRIQKRIETWCEGIRLFDMKWRGEALDRTRSTNHMTAYITKLDPNPKEWVYQIPNEEMNANDAITFQDQNP